METPPGQTIGSSAEQKKPLSVGGRLLLGFGLSVIAGFLIAILMDLFAPKSTWMLQPMWWVSTFIHNANATPLHINLANGIFWGFLIAFTIRRRR